MSIQMYNPKAPNQILPGPYVNVSSGRAAKSSASERGTVLIPLLGMDYGPEDEVLTIESNFPDQYESALGHSVQDIDVLPMRLIRDAMLNATRVKVWIPKSGQRAEATCETVIVTEQEPLEDGTIPDPITSEGELTATARYGGTRGNALSFTITANPMGGKDVSIYLDNELQESFENVATVKELVAMNSAWIEFAGEGDLANTAGVALTGGTTPDTTVADLMGIVDVMDDTRFGTLALPIDGHDEDAVPVIKAVCSKIRQLRNERGLMVRVAAANYAGDYGSVVNITNGTILNDGTVITEPIATAWYAGLEASTPNTKSNTWVSYPDAVRVYRPKNTNQQKQAILNGEMFFIEQDNHNIVICADINSLTSTGRPNDETYQQNVVQRVIDTFVEALREIFVPGKYPVSRVGFDQMDADGAALLKQFELDGAIKNVDAKEDFKVDRTKSTDMNAFIGVYMQPVMLAEKIYIDVKTL